MGLKIGFLLGLLGRSSCQFQPGGNTWLFNQQGRQAIEVGSSAWALIINPALSNWNQLNHLTATCHMMSSFPYISLRCFEIKHVLRLFIYSRRFDYLPNTAGCHKCTLTDPLLVFAFSEWFRGTCSPPLWHMVQSSVHARTLHSGRELYCHLDTDAMPRWPRLATQVFDASLGWEYSSWSWNLSRCPSMHSAGEGMPISPNM